MDRKRHHSTEFKKEAVRLARESDRPITEVAKELNVGRTTLYSWMIEEHEEEKAARLSGESPEEELKRLRRENKILKMEREILKKATAFFAKEKEKGIDS